MRQYNEARAKDDKRAKSSQPGSGLVGARHPDCPPTAVRHLYSIVVLPQEALWLTIASAVLSQKGN
jgi:hypothetical protein